MSKKKKQEDKSQPKKKQQAFRIDKRKILAALGGILGLTFIVYWQSTSNGFVNLDDDRYITNNPLILHVDPKLFFSKLQWMGNYHPLVLWVYSIIYSVAELTPSAYHRVELCFHLLNTSLVLFVILELTSLFEIAVVVSMLFGISPMHVESVAWISELKDLMYTAGFLGSAYMYIRYVRSDFKRKFFIWSIIFFFLSVLSKGMGVSLPIVLLLIDYYLGRKITRSVVAEKIPFFVLSLIFGIVAIKAQQELGAVQDLAVYSFPQRIVFACYAFITYIWKCIVPVHLSAYYGYPVKTGNTIDKIYYLYLPAVIALLTIVFLSVKRTRKLFFGIGFYSVTVALVLQLLPVGGCIIADRYSYIPSIGIFMLVAWLLFEIYQKSSAMKITAITLFAIMTVAYSYMTFERTKVWKDGLALWGDAIEKGTLSAIAYNNHGVLLKLDGKLNEAMADYKNALKLNPRNEDSWSNIGLIYWQLGLPFTKKADSLFSIAYKTAINQSDFDKTEPNSVAAMAKFYNPEHKDRFIETTLQNAFKCFHEGIKCKDSVELYFANATANLDTAIAISPDFATAYENRGSVRSTMGDQQGAIADYTKAIQLDPNFSDPLYNRGLVYYKLGRKNEACADLNSAAQLGHQTARRALNDLCK